jgi:hypothetical protein
MTGLTFMPRRLVFIPIAKSVRLVLVVLVALALIGLSFVLGRASIGDSKAQLPVTGQYSAPLPVGSVAYLCHVNDRC